VIASGKITSPCSMALTDEGSLFVADDEQNLIFRFNADGSYQSTVPTDEGVARPRAIAAGNGLLFVADAASGFIGVLDYETEAWLGTLAGYRGPVSAMALADDGALYIKAGLGPDYHCLKLEQDHINSGELLAGPFDAGAGAKWERVFIKAETPQDTEATLRTYTAATTDNFDSNKWKDAPAHDILLEPYLGRAADQESLRFLWISVSLKNQNPKTTPRLLQVQAQTTGQSYLEFLPAIYRRDDTDGFLESWLALFRSRLQDFEFALDDAARRFDPLLGERDHLQWLSKQLAFDLPNGLNDADQRSVLNRLYSLYAKRGTIEGIRDFVELYTGIRPLIFEAFRQRHIWQLGHPTASLLGCNTALAAALPDGMIVPGFSPTDGEFRGLHGDYYQGVDFRGPHILTRIDESINFSPDALSQVEQQTKRYSVRWNGQIRPRFAETYAFWLNSNQVARLWIDGRKIIDNHDGISASNPDQPIEIRKRMLLNDDRWYPIQVEFVKTHDTKIPTTLVLSWSSRSQLKEPIPGSRLYALSDEHAVAEEVLSSETLVVGQTVVGESGPAQSEQFGEPLISDTAHLFTVMVIAAQLKDEPKRALLKKIIEAEKPAHTDYHLCFIEPRMRVGFQARIGVDSIIAGPAEPMNLSGTVLGLDSYLGVDESGGNYGRVGKHSHIGQNTFLE
jgi:phage tail-like protein